MVQDAHQEGGQGAKMVRYGLKQTKENTKLQKKEVAKQAVQ